eukprot:g33441.t1
METEGREVRLLTNEVGPQAPLPQHVVVPEATSKSEMSRRVLYLSVLLAVYVVVNALVHYAFDVAAIESAISQIRAVTEMKGRYDMAGLLIGLMPGLAYSIVLGLLAP